MTSRSRRALVARGLAALGDRARAPNAVSKCGRALGGRGDVTAIAIVRDSALPRVVLAALVGAALAHERGGAAGHDAQPARRAVPARRLRRRGGRRGHRGRAAVRRSALVPRRRFAGALAAVVLVLVVARAGGRRPDPRVLLMAGVVVGAFANAAIMVALALGAGGRRCAMRSGG